MRALVIGLLVLLVVVAAPVIGVVVLSWYTAPERTQS